MVEMTPRQRMLAVFGGAKPDCCPVAAPYTYLSDADHWCELTGEPLWRFYDWLHDEDADEHARVYARFREKIPFDVLEPWHSSSSANRHAISVVQRDGVPFFHDSRSQKTWPIPTDTHTEGSGGGPNETRRVWDKADVTKHVHIAPAENALADGSLDFLTAVVRMYGENRFIIGGGIVNTFYSCSWYVGLTNLFALLLEDEELITYLSNRILESNVERIRALAATGCDAIYIDDATATSDLISVAHYEKFSLPYIKEEVREIKALGKKAIVIYFGGVADRIDQIASIGADAIIVEASMKGYVNDIGEIARCVGDRAVLFGNLNPREDVELPDDDELARRIRQQYDALSPHCRFVVSTGSPLTPMSPVSRLAKFVELGHSMG